MFNESQRYIIASIMSVICVIMIIVLVLSLSLSQKIIYDSNQDLMTAYSNQFSDRLSLLFDSVYTSFSGKSINGQALETMQSSDEGIREKLIYYCNQYDISDFVFYSIDNKRTYFENSKDADNFENKLIRYSINLDTAFNSKKFICFYDDIDKFVYMVMPVYDNEKKVGHFCMGFELSSIRSYLSNLYSPFTTDVEKYLITPDNCFIKSLTSSEDFKSYIYECSDNSIRDFGLTQDGKVFFSKATICSNLDMIFTLSSTTYKKDINEMSLYLAELVVALLLASFLIIISFTNNMLFPLKELNERMHTELKSINK